MRRLGLLLVVMTAAMADPAGAAAFAPVTAVQSAPSAGAPLAARFGARPRVRPTVRRRAPIYPRTRRTYRRPSVGRSFRTALRVLGIAYLVHALFGWGHGGSPAGLLILLVVAAWLITRRSRRRTYAHARW